VAVYNVIVGSPAFDADILVGDVIQTIDGKPIAGAADYTALLESKVGRQIDLTLYRHGSVITKSVKLNP